MDCGNYGPISIQPIPLEVLEQAVNEQFQNKVKYLQCLPLFNGMVMTDQPWHSCSHNSANCLCSAPRHRVLPLICLHTLSHCLPVSSLVYRVSFFLGLFRTGCPWIVLQCRPIRISEISFDRNGCN